MNRMVLMLVAGLVGAATACGDVAQPVERPFGTRILITDAPFPYASLRHANIHIVRLSTFAPFAQGDTTGLSNEPMVVAEPDRVFDLLALQNGVTEVLGETALPVEEIGAVELVIDPARSGLVWSDGSAAEVRWPANTELAFGTSVEGHSPDGTGGNVVVDFDLGRSFFFDNVRFHFQQYLRAVNDRATGTLTGTVRGPAGDGAAAVPSATITVLRGQPLFPSGWSVVATGRTDAEGRFMIPYLVAGLYIVQADGPSDGAVQGRDWNREVVIAVGEETDVTLTLSDDAIDAGAELRILGARPLTVGASATLLAVLYEHLNADTAVATGVPPDVAWINGSPDILGLEAAAEEATVTGLRLGRGIVFARSEALTDSVYIDVIPDTTAASAAMR